MLLKNTFYRCVPEVLLSILLFQNSDEGLDLEISKSAGFGKTCFVVADVELTVYEMHICFDTRASRENGRIHRDFVPIVVVRVARDGCDIAGEIGWIPIETFCSCSGFSPVLWWIICVRGSKDFDQRDDEEDCSTEDQLDIFV